MSELKEKALAKCKEGEFHSHVECYFVEGFCTGFNECSSALKVIEQQNATLKKQLEILKEALEFYSSYSSWGGDSRLGSDIDESDCDYIEKWHETIGGKRAREAIQKVKELMNEKGN